MIRLCLQKAFVALLSGGLLLAVPAAADPFNPTPSSAGGGVDERLKEFRRDMYREQQMRRERQDEAIEKLQSQIEELKNQNSAAPSEDDGTSDPPQEKETVPPAPGQSMEGYIPVGVLNGEYVVRRQDGFGQSKTVSESQYNKLTGSGGKSEEPPEPSQKGSSDEESEVQD